MSTETLTDWLLRQVADDEAAANERIDREVSLMRRDGLPDTTRDNLPASWRRPLAECEAKRRIVALHSERRGTCPHCVDPEDSREFEAWPCSTLRLLALPYADRPGYLESWRP